MLMAPPSCEAVIALAHPEADVFANGTRLHVLRYRFEGDTREVWAAISRVGYGDYLPDPEFFDTALGVPCAPMPWDDGSVRCTPGEAYTQLEYLDAGCQVRASRASDRILRSRDTSCPNATVLRSRAMPVTASLFHIVNGSCAADGLPAGPVFPIDVVVNATDLVEITATTGLLTFDHVGLGFDASADGMSRPSRLVDARLGGRCGFERVAATDSAVVCVPDDLLGAGTYFTDDRCKMPLEWSPVPNACDPSPPRAVAAVAGSFDDACGVPAMYTAVPAGPPRSQRSDLGHGVFRCDPVTTPPSDRSFFTKGDRMPLISASRCPGASTDRIQSIYIGTTNVHVRDGLYDTQLGVSCKVMATAGGTLRCVPETAASTWTYAWADASCTVPLVEPFPNPVPAYALDLDAAGVPTGYRKVGAEYTGPVFLRDDLTGCVSVSSTLTYYTTSDLIDIATLPAATMVTD